MEGILSWTLYTEGQCTNTKENKQFPSEFEEGQYSIKRSNLLNMIK